MMIPESLYSSAAFDLQPVSLRIDEQTRPIGQLPIGYHHKFEEIRVVPPAESLRLETDPAD